MSDSNQPAFTFDEIDAKFESLANRDFQECLLQWNLDVTLSLRRFRFNGYFPATSTSSDYQKVLKDFVNSNQFASNYVAMGVVANPVQITAEEMNISILNMNFFDRLYETVASKTGIIRGCYEEVISDITVNDKLREFLVNEDSENSHIYTEDEKKEVIFAILKILAVGGSMCQPDPNLERYVNVCKAMYKDILTVYK